MSRYFTHYWDNATWAAERARGDEGKPLGTFYGNQFSSRHLQAGDVVYAMTVLQGDLYVLCRVAVARVGKVDGEYEGRWREALVVEPGTSTPRHFANRVPYEVTQRLTFVTPQGVTTLHSAATGKLDAMTFRQMRELTPESAAMLDEVLDDYDRRLIQAAGDLRSATGAS